MSIIVQVIPPAGDPIVLDPIGAEGAIGSNGWTAVLAIANDGARRVLKVVDWAGGEGTKPAVGQYVGAGSALVDDIADAVDIRGPQGVQGPAGDPGQIITSGGIFTGDGPPNDADHIDGDIYIDTASGDLYQKQAGHWVLQTNIKGGKGDPGTPGAPGTPGTAGTNGATILIGSGVPAGGLGAVGDIYIEGATFTLYQKTGSSAWTQVGVFKGAAGSSVRVAAGAPDNAVGVNGDSYINASNGDIYIRTAGTYSIAGNLRGPQGLQGIQGIQGIQGPAGTSTRFGSGAPAPGLGLDGDSYIDTAALHLYTKSAGAWSDAGSLKGTNGVNGEGNAIHTGNGAPGVIGGSIDGDIYINLVNGDVYQKQAGAFAGPLMNMRGPQGLQGPAGPKGDPGNGGVPGSSLISGAGAPSNALGSNGDTYLNSSNGDVYGPKVSGAWPSPPAGNLRGAQGLQGIQGIQGDPGTPGAPGSPGSAGTRGTTWSTGSGNPVSLTGRINGDVYINSANGQFWQVAAGAWADQGFNIKGPQGTAGSNGAAGPSNLPQNSQSAAYTTVLTDAGKHIFHPAADTTARTWNIDHSLAYAIGDTISFINENGAGVITIGITGGTAPTLRQAGAASTGNRSLAPNGVASAVKVSASTWYISGAGLT